MEEGRIDLKCLIGKLTRSPMCRWKDIIRISPKGKSNDTKNWINFAQDMDYRRTFVNAALNVRFPQAMDYGGGPCTLLNTGQGRPSNCVHIPVCEFIETSCL